MEEQTDPVIIIERAGSGNDDTISFDVSLHPDFVLIWNESTAEATTDDAYGRRSVFEYNLEEEGLILQWENSESNPELHAVKIWATLEVLKRYSEILRLRLPMKQLPEDVARVSRKSNIAECWINWGKYLRPDPEALPERDRKLTGVYNRDKEYLFDVDESNMLEIFPPSVRSRIVQYILKRKPYKIDEDFERDAFAFGYERLIKQGVYEAGYPLHDGTLSTEGSMRNLLFLHWGRFSQWLKYQPLDLIKDYFGVNFALYFAWLGYYTRMLVYAAIFGIVCFIFGTASFGADQFVKDVCDEELNITMCPLCDSTCPYWKLSERCHYARITHLFDNDFTVVFALLMSIWTAFFLEFWKRYSATMTHQWDLTGFDLKDSIPRPEYVAVVKKMYPAGTDGEEEDGKGRKYDNLEISIPFWRKRLPSSVASYSMVLLLIALALGALLGVIIYRLWMHLMLSQTSENEEDLSWQRLVVSATAAFINLTFIMLFARVYKRIAVKLTEMEYPRTQQEFEASYILKIYLLEFVNNYSSIFYVAFFKGAFVGAPHNYTRLFGSLRQEECGLSCMSELCIQLAVIMIGKQSKSMLMESFFPFLKRTVKRVTKRFKHRTRVTTVESESTPVSRRTSTPSPQGSPAPQWMNDFDLLEWEEYALSDEYLEMVLQFGFVTIFVAAFPLAPFFALINNIFELRVDASKLLRHYRRPIGIRVRDIGVWSDIVSGIIKLAVLSNACIIATTSSFIPKFVYRYFIQESSDPNFGTLNGYLQSSLTSFNTDDIEMKPEYKFLGRLKNATECFYPTRRYSSTDAPRKYDFKEEHWKIWLARVSFILLYENFVVVMLLILRWIIPDMPSRLRSKIQREERMINELIMKQELQRAQKVMSARHSRMTEARLLQMHRQHHSLFNEPTANNNEGRHSHNQDRASSGKGKGSAQGKSYHLHT